MRTDSMCVTVAAGLRSGSWIQAAVPGLVSNTGAWPQREPFCLFDAVVQGDSPVVSHARLSRDSPAIAHDSPSMIRESTTTGVAEYTLGACSSGGARVRFFRNSRMIIQRDSCVTLA